MDCRQLEVFCKIVELKSFSRAADAVELTQPTVSGHIMALERDLGVKLLDRLGREVVPTQAGKTLYGYATRILKLRDEASQAMARMTGDLRGRLEIAASTIPGTYILPHHLKAFAARYPEVTVSVRIGDTKEVVNLVLDRELEVGMVGAKLEASKLHFEPLAEDELVLIVAPEHPWAQREEVEARELAGQPLVLREKGSGTRMRLEQALKAAGLSLAQLSVAAEIATNEAIKQAVSSGLGAAFVSDLAVAEERKNGTLRALALKGVSLKRTFYVIRRRGVNLSPASETFLEFLLKEVAEPGTPGRETRRRS